VAISQGDWQVLASPDIREEENRRKIDSRTNRLYVHSYPIQKVKDVKEKGPESA